MSANDTIELIFDNPSGAALSLDLARVADTAEVVRRLAAGLVMQIVAERAEVLPLRLVDAGQGSLHFKFALKIEFKRSANANPTSGGKDALTLTSEVVGLVMAFLALASPSPPPLPRNADPEYVQALEKARELREHVGPLVNHVDELARAAALAGSEHVTIRARDLEVVLLGSDGVRSGQIASRPKRPLAPYEPSMTGTIKIPSDTYVTVQLGEQTFQASVVSLTLRRGQHHEYGAGDYDVLAVWRSPPPAEMGERELEVRFSMVQPGDVRPSGEIGPHMEQLDGIIVINAKRSWN